MTTTLLTLLMTPAYFTPVADGSAATELQYRATLIQRTRSGNTPVRTMKLYCLVTPQDKGRHQIRFAFDETGMSDTAWPEQFGQLQLGPGHQKVAGRDIRFFYDHDGTMYPIVVACPVFEHFQRLQKNRAWQSGKLEFAAGTRKTRNGRTVQEVEAFSNFGRSHQFLVDLNSALVVKLEQKLVMGRGDEFTLQLELASTRPVDKRRLTLLNAPLKTLLELQDRLKRKPDQSQKILSDQQLRQTQAVLAQLEQQAKGTPFARLANNIEQDVTAQTRRGADISRLAATFLGKKAPRFTLTGLNGKPIPAEQWRNKIVVLHFWSYQSEPLVEPYGQIGYLDFLYNRRHKLGVEFFGVAVHPDLSADSADSRKTLRSVRKLKEFMNLSYPLAIDDGQLLRKFGDPRTFDAKLPLWVVITPAGTVAEYKVGLFSIRADEGLKQLDTSLIKLIRQQKAKAKAK